MNTHDLTKHAPRSPKESLGGIITLPRFIDKVRAYIAGTLGEYMSGNSSAIDKKLMEFIGISYEEFKAEVEKKATDEELLEWIKTHGTNHSDEEIQTWSTNFEHMLAKNDPDRQAYISFVLEKTGLNPETTTTFDWIDFDDAMIFSK